MWLHSQKYIWQKYLRMMRMKWHPICPGRCQSGCVSCWTFIFQPVGHKLATISFNFQVVPGMHQNVSQLRSNASSGLNHMTAVLQTPFLNAFSWKILLDFFIQNSHKVVSDSTIEASIGSGNGLAPNRRQAITWTNDDTSYWRIYTSTS